MCQPTSKGCVHFIWAGWSSWPKRREAGFAAQKDLCSCKHSVSHTALYIPSPIHMYVSWLKHKCFFCKDAVVRSEFSSLVEKRLKMLILMLSSLHVSLLTVTCSHQFKRQLSPGEDSNLWKTGGLCPFLSFSTCCASLLIMPFHHSVTPFVCWASSPVHGKWQDCMAKIGGCEKEKCKSLLAKVNSATSQHVLRPYIALMLTGWPSTEQQSAWT